MSEIEIRSENIAAQKAVFLRLLDRYADILQCQRILLAHVNVTLMGADGIGADDQSFQDRVRISFEHGTVHESARDRPHRH